MQKRKASLLGWLILLDHTDPRGSMLALVIGEDEAFSHVMMGN
jgi:hypothetical protein